VALRCARAQRRRPPAQADVAELPSGGDNSYPGFIALDVPGGCCPTIRATKAAPPSTWPSSVSA